VNIYKRDSNLLIQRDVAIVVRTIIEPNYQSGYITLLEGTTNASMSFRNVVLLLLHKIDVTEKPLRGKGK